MKISNGVDEEWFIGYPKAQRFIEESGIRAETLRQFYKDKGTFIFAFKTENLAELCPYFILNYSSAETLNSLAGIKIYPSIGGFYIKFKDQKTLNEIKTILNGVPIHVSNDSDVSISEIEINNNKINAKIIYTYDRSTRLFFPKSPIHVNITIAPTEDKCKFVVYGEIFRWQDFAKLRSFYSLSHFQNIFSIIDINFNKISNSKDKHKIVNMHIDSTKDLSLKVDGENTNFELLGTYEHKALGVTDLSPKKGISYFTNSNKLNTETNIIKLKELISELEKQAGKCISFIKCVYFSRELNKYISLSFYYDKYFFITFNSVYVYPEEKIIKGKEIIHPKDKQELYSFNRRVIGKQEIMQILSAVWLKSVNNIYNEFDK